MSPWKPLYLCFLPVLLGIPSLSGQEAVRETGVAADFAAESAVDSIPADAALYIIRGIEYHLTGRTQPWALAYHTELREGEQLKGKAALDAYMARKTQALRNQRVLKEDTSRLEYTLGEAEEDGALPVYLRVYAEDTWNFIILPEPKFDSNTGFSLTFKARDYNLLGTMSPLKVDLGYEYGNRGLYSSDDDDKKRLFLSIDSDVPFQALGYRWNINFDNDFAYIIDDSVFSYTNTTGISVELPFRATVFTLGFDQSFLVNPENEDDEWEATGASYFSDLWHMASELYAQWKIPTGVELGSFGELTYTPRLAGLWKYRPNGEIGEYRRGPTAKAGHTLGFSRIDWLGNYRRGFDVSLGNDNEYNLSRQIWNNSIDLTAIAHLPITEWFGISARFKTQVWFNDTYTTAGELIRGRRDKALHADHLIAVNLELPFRVFRFVPSEWSGKPKLHTIDFELYLAPFLDMVMVKDPSPEHPHDFTPGDILVAAGIEAMIFPLRWRSFYMRFSAGWNLRKKEEPLNQSRVNDDREFFIGVGHFF
ncbi:hypothetical protein FACS189468_2070 [Spirochaetia bacterium]|nr:hypothetical protein FACS189468_2070 [Spirochaetia bacterium]